MVYAMEHKIKRRHCRVVNIGSVAIGGKNPIAVQSMVKVPTKETGATIRQIEELQKSGCEIIRVAVKDVQDAQALAEIKKNISIPLVADIHFNYRFALTAIDAGVDKVRLNPGNIYKKDEVREVASLARQRKIPIRVGSNSGSLLPRYRSRKNIVTALVAQTYDYVKALEDYGVRNIVISLKSSNMFETMLAYRKMAAFTLYPLHVGVTATGMLYDGIVKSSIGIGALLMEGIGDTIRVSLLADSCDEIAVAYSILATAGMRRFGPEYICCPTCGRCDVDLQQKARELSGKIKAINQGTLKKATIALMGCVVNGPGEAAHADIGVAFGKGKGLLFKKGKPLRTVAQQECVEALVKELKKL